MSIKEIMDNQVDVSDIVKLYEIIESAQTLKTINSIRMACVEAMKEHPAVLKMWQAKYWSLKNCPTCGKAREG